jgi:UDP-N-acetylmuramyl pentapeptide phosphotransferase/UDP-N-acetylglucosamine-1-phosphate transferase
MLLDKYIYVFVFMIGLSIVYLRTAKYFNLLDHPNKRSSHSKPIIRGMGILFYFSLIFYFIDSGFQNTFFFVGASIAAIISFLDDIKPLNWLFRLFFHALSIFFLLLELNIFDLYDLFGVLLFTIAGLSFVNFYNFMDGINGLMSLNSLLTLFSVLFLNYNENIVDVDLIIYPVLAILVFAYYNVRRNAIAFSGDVGSLFLGALLFFFICSLSIGLNSPIIIMLVLVHFVDAAGTVFIRLIKGNNISIAHRDHIYEKLVDSGIPHLKVSFFYTGLQLIINLFVFYLYESSLSLQIFIIVLFFTISISLYLVLLKYLKSKKEIN